VAILTKRRHNRPKEVRPYSALAERVAADPRFKRFMAQRVQIDRTHDIPYLAGYSEDGKIVYFDRHFKPFMSKDVDTTPFLLVHEKAEKACITLFKLKYQHAHEIATYLEYKAVIKAGIDWNEYSNYLEPFIRKTERERIRRVPKNLDLKPYRDEHDVKHLRAMKKAAKTPNGTLETE